MEYANNFDTIKCLKHTLGCNTEWKMPEWERKYLVIIYFQPVSCYENY